MDQSPRLSSAEKLCRRTWTHGEDAEHHVCRSDGGHGGWHVCMCGASMLAHPEHLSEVTGEPDAAGRGAEAL